MSWFIKTERFTKKTLSFLPSERKVHLEDHLKWVQKLSSSGVKIASGYLINEQKEPGGGGWLIIEAKDFETAKSLIINDPMIKRDLVKWRLQEWISVYGNLLS